jgi:L-histidine N-alpha-methyltransferase
MRLRAERATTVRVATLDLTVEFAEGEEMRTEISAKFRPAGVREMLGEAGFAVSEFWSDPEERFGLSLATAV